MYYYVFFLKMSQIITLRLSSTSLSVSSIAVWLVANVHSLCTLTHVDVH